MYFTKDKITEIFYLTDEFYLEFQKTFSNPQQSSETS